MHFLCSPCVVDKGRVKSITLGNTKPMVIDNNGKLQVGASKLHISHKICCYKGLFYCMACGYHASAKAQHLAKECIARGPAAQKRVAHLGQGKLPSGLKQWPNELHHRAHMVELYDDDGAEYVNI